MKIQVFMFTTYFTTVKGAVVPKLLVGLTEVFRYCFTIPFLYEIGLWIIFFFFP